MIKRLCAFLTGRRCVWLKDADGKVTLSIARVDAWGELTAKRYWPFNIRHVQLLPDGKVDGCYVKRWKYTSDRAAKDPQS